MLHLAKKMFDPGNQTGVNIIGLFKKFPMYSSIFQLVNCRTSSFNNHWLHLQGLDPSAPEGADCEGSHARQHKTGVVSAAKFLTATSIV